MILQALCAYYQRIPDVAAPGFGHEKISFCLVIDAAGKLVSIDDLRSNERGKVRPSSLVVPYRGKRTVGVQANFLWDNTGYVLGLDGKGKPERTADVFAAFSDLLQSIAVTTTDDGLAAVVAFLAKWNPAAPDPLVTATDGLMDSNVVFRVQGRRQYVHESQACQGAWSRFVAAESAREATRGICLVTGDEAPIALLHEPAIKGVVGAQTSGASIVSFNLDSFTSYGKAQNLNAPVSEAAAFRYTTALNHLLADRKHRARIADATVVWWTEKPTQIEDLFGNLLDTSAVSEDEVLRDQLARFVDRLRTASPGRADVDAEVPFYILGLSPNASRLSIRLWQVSTVAELSGRLGAHFNDLAICGARDGDPPLSLYRLLRETAREAKDIPPLLGGAVLKAVLSGGLYPDALLTSVARRVHADGTFNHPRAAIVKAWLNRKFRTFGTGKELPMSLDVSRADPAYLLGRLFATLEKIQEDASGGSLNRTVKDSYFTSAAATPAGIFPRLLRLSHHHQRKLGGGLAVVRNRLIQEIMAPLQTFPAFLSLEEQGVFYIGYYHQRQDFFTRKEQPDGTEERSDASALASK